MKYLKSYKLFESDSTETFLGITKEEIGDIIQDMLDVFPGLTYVIEMRPKTSELSLFNEVDYFIIKIESDVVFDDTPFQKMVAEVDAKLEIYGLEIFYVSPLATRSIGENLFVKRISDKSRVYEKVPEIKNDHHEDEMGVAISLPPQRNESHSFDEIESNVKDILQDAVDDGLGIIFKVGAKDKIFHPDEIKVTLYSPTAIRMTDAYFNYDDVSGLVKRLNAYMDQEGYNARETLDGDRRVTYVIMTYRKKEPSLRVRESLNRPVDLISTLEDIAWDLKDDGYDVRILNLSQPIKPLGQKFPRITVSIKKSVDGVRQHIDINQISNCIRRMCKYMESEGYRHWVFPGLGSSSHFVKADELNSVQKIFPNNLSNQIEVRFKR